MSTKLDDELILMDPTQGQYLTFNAVATRAFEILENRTDFETLCGAIVEEFEVSPSQCRRDLSDLLSDLVTRKIVVVD